MKLSLSQNQRRGVLLLSGLTIAWMVAMAVLWQAGHWSDRRFLASSFLLLWAMAVSVGPIVRDRANLGRRVNQTMLIFGIFLSALAGSLAVAGMALAQLAVTLAVGFGRRLTQREGLSADESLLLDLAAPALVLAVVFPVGLWFEQWLEADVISRDQDFFGLMLLIVASLWGDRERPRENLLLIYRNLTLVIWGMAVFGYPRPILWVGCALAACGALVWAAIRLRRLAKAPAT